MAQQRVKLSVKQSLVDVTATGLKVGSAVPVGRRWRLHSISAALNSGTFTMTVLGLQDPNGASVNLATGSAAASMASFLGHYVDMEAGWKPSFWVDAKTGDGNAYVSLLVEDLEA